MATAKLFRLIQFMRNAIFGAGGLRDHLSYFLRRAVYVIRKFWTKRPADGSSVSATTSNEANAISRAMEHEGYFLPSSPMPEIDTVIAKLTDIISNLIRQSGQASDDVTHAIKTYWVDLNNELNLAKNPEFVQLLNSPVLMEAARQYLGDTPVISGLTLVRTIGSTDNLASPLASQMWHFDNDDMKIFKLFVYLTDVSTPADGPFTLVSAALSKKAVRQLLFKLKLRSRVPDQDFFNAIGSADGVIEVFGKTGSWFMADTHRCYHFGSRTTSSRIALFVTYISPVSLTRPAMNLAN